MGIYYQISRVMLCGRVRSSKMMVRWRVRYVGYGGTVRWVQWVRYGGYGGYGTVGTVGTVRWVRWVRYGGYSGYGTVGMCHMYLPVLNHQKTCFSFLLKLDKAYIEIIVLSPDHTKYHPSGYLYHLNWGQGFKIHQPIKMVHFRIITLFF